MLLTEFKHKKGFFISLYIYITSLFGTEIEPGIGRLPNPGFNSTLVL